MVLVWPQLYQTDLQQQLNYFCFFVVTFVSFYLADCLQHIMFQCSVFSFWPLDRFKSCRARTQKSQSASINDQSIPVSARQHSVCCTELHRAVTSAPSETLERCAVPALSQMLSPKITVGAHDALKAVWEWIQTTRFQHLAGEPESTDGIKDDHIHRDTTHCLSESFNDASN